MSEWKETRLGEIINVQNGYAFKSEDFETKGIPVIKIKNIASGEIIWNDIQFFSKPEFDEAMPHHQIKSLSVFEQ
jgi:type I restriction enzyme, S subunit